MKVQKEIQITIVSFTVKDFVGENLASFFIDGELGAFLVGLLYDGIFNLAVDSFVSIRSLNTDNWRAIGSAFFDLWAICRAFREHGLIVVHVRDEDDNNGC